MNRTAEEPYIKSYMRMCEGVFLCISYHIKILLDTVSE